MSHELPPRCSFESWPTGRLLTAAARLVEHAFDSEVSRLGVTHAGVNVLDALAEGPRAQRELADRCQVQDQTMSRTLEGLERAGHVLRQRDPGDRRRIIVERTASGEKLLDQAHQAAARLGFFESSTEEESRVCRDLLIKLIARLGGRSAGPRR